MDAQRFYIGGEWVESCGEGRVTVLCPSDLTPIGHAAMGTIEDADRAVRAASAAFDVWQSSNVADRLELIQRMRAAFAKAAPGIADHLVREIGLTPMVAQGQTAMCLSHFDSIIDLLPGYRFSEALGDRIELVREPVGVVAAITSWNAPVSQMLCKAVPAIAAGCTVVVKPSEHAPLCGLLLAEAMAEADIPAGVFNLINGRGVDCGRRLAEHPDVAMISMTGSVAGGGAMAAAAAAGIKRIHQELGGKSPNVILPDADFAESITKGVHICMMNAGQTCAAPTRLIVPADRFDEAAAIAVAAAQKLMVGPPDQPGVTYGPLANKAQFERVNATIERAIAEGQPLLTGGPGRPSHVDNGYFVRPTIFGPVAPDARIAQEEIFGPVLCILCYSDIDDAIRIANSTDFGLSAYVETPDPVLARRVAGAIRAGWVNINYPPWTGAAPFGGYRRSGNGRQYGVWGFEEFLETKAIVH